MNKAPPVFQLKFDHYDALAVQAVALGTANDAQQKRALKWIIEDAARTYDESFIPGDMHGTNFSEGRRFVGLRIVRLLKMSQSEIEELKNKGVKR